MTDSSDRDAQIIRLFWGRSETAITETASAYHSYCMNIANHVLHDSRDAEECVNDAYNRLWNLIPPNRPRSLPAFLGKLVRDIAIDRLRRNLASKRGAAETVSILDECGELAQNADLTYSIDDKICLKDLMNRFLEGLSKEKRIMFMRRYWYMHSIREIAHSLGLSESCVKVTLLRIRKDLKDRLLREGFV